jgi:N6-L-threonylcarbamoyladenine synthase
MEEEIAGRRELFAQAGQPSLDQILSLTAQPTLDLIAAFQYTVVSELLRRAFLAAEERAVEAIIVSGGVAANSGLRKAFESLRWPVFFPSLALATDNAAMIAAAAYPRLLRGERSGLDLHPQPSLALAC